mmetsp:Transcript_19016/g.27018  ORF Transcript_19016/g.27018 Transcript_19016/m.27018 type:complete len:197 (+) Transcript_19016:82-672(+)
MTMYLSPLAVPFEPTARCNNAALFHIYNNGVPSMVNLCGEYPVIEGISDEAIETLFPPTLEEIQEMEEVDFFVELLAEIDVLEDRDLRARSFADIKKRWSSRRKEGVPVGGGSRQGRHRQPRIPNPVAGVPMACHHRVSEEIVPYNANQAKLTHFHGDSQIASRLKKKKNMNNKTSNNSWAFRGNMKPIMQPKQGF